MVTDGTNVFAVPASDLNQQNPINGNQQPTQTEQGGQDTQTAPQQETQQQAQPQSYNVEDEIVLTDDNGNQVTATVTNIDADGTYTLSADSPINGKRVLTMSADEIASRQQASQPQTEEETAPQAEQKTQFQEQTEQQGEQDYETMQPEQAFDKLVADMGGATIAVPIATAQMEQAKAELEKLQKKAPKLSGTPAEMKQALSEHNAKIAEAQRKLDAWTAINAVPQQRRAEEQKRIREESDSKQAEASAKAVAELEQQKKQEAERQAEQERIGANAVNPKISEKWNNAPKVEGNTDILTLADGTTLEGHYVLTEAGSASASHDINNAFEPTEGFPVDENGQNINDRDYQRDQEAQRRALQTPVVVSNDGIVLSGNNRTMSGDLAAKQGTDTAYIEYLRKYGAKYGFTTEQIDGMQHPRVVFVPTEQLPYTSETFARFNAEEKKTQNKSEKAVKMGKVVADDVFKAIVAEIARYDTLSDFYGNKNSVKFAMEMLLESGVINANNMAELLDNGNISAIGKELLENVLIGKAFQANPDAVRQIIAIPSLRQAIVMGLSEIAVNRTLDNAGYGLSEELANAIGLVYKARTDIDANVKVGDAVSAYARQLGLFDYEFGEMPIEDITTLLLADILNSTKPSDLRKVLALYNASASVSASGQMDMFSGAVRTKQEILTDVNNTFNNANNKERERIATEAIADRKQRAEETAQTATAQRGNQASEEEVEQPSNAQSEKATLIDVVRTLYAKGKEYASKLFSMKFFDVAQTPRFMKELGLTGDKFTIRYGVIARHYGKDNEHNLPEEVWEQLPNALQNPFAITKYYTDEHKQKQKGYRLYTSLKLANGSFVVVSAEVKSVGRDIEVNAINTIFGRDTLSEVHDELIYTSKTITPELSSLLNENNLHQYPTEQELSDSKDSELSQKSKQEAEA